MEDIEIVINDIKFTIPDYLKDQCEKYGVDIYSEYADKITTIHSPHLKIKNYSMNVFNAFYEKVYRTKYGPFVQIENNKIINQSNELYDLLKNDPDKKYRYDFLYFYNKQMIPNQEKYLFYGVEIKRIYYPNIENEPRPYILDDLIKTNLKYVKKLSKGKKDIYEADLKWRCFGICRLIQEWYSWSTPKHFQSAISEDLYKSSLEKLFKRYLYKNELLFQKVENLNDFKDKIGIYVLCIESKRMIYIGQATVSLRNRILQHLNQRHTSFDNSIFPSEITEIYVMPTPHDLEMIDKIETDGIATIDMKIPENANVLASLFLIETVGKGKYNPSDFLLVNQTLEKYKKRISIYKKRNS